MKITKGQEVDAIIMDAEKQLIREFMKTCTVEVTPGGAAKVDDFAVLLREGTTVYVTFLPGSDFADTLRTVCKLHDQGMNPVPHFAARSIPSKDFLEANLKMLQAEVKVDHALLIGGAVDRPLGEFHSSMQVLQTGLFEKHGIRKCGLASHPEGTPDITDADVAQAIRDKNAYQKETDMQLYLATQFCFESKPILQWEKRIREQEGNELPIHIGIPGLATIKTLIKHAQHCGIGPSMRVLTRQAANIAKLMTVRQPNNLVLELAKACKADPGIGIAQCHLYPLGGLKKSAAWLHAVQDGHFEAHEKDGFRLTVDIG